ANDDQPGPIGRRHIWTGGCADQSVTIGTPRTMPSRSDPRKPGQFPPGVDGATVDGGAAGTSPSPTTAGFSGAFVATGLEGSAGASPARAAGGLSAFSAGAVVDGTATGSSRAWARSRSSGVGVHRQWRSDLP